VEKFIYDLSVLLAGAAILSFVAIRLKQPIIIAYIVCGVVVGPWGLGLVKNIEFIETISHLGVTLLLFLAGLCLHPQHLIKLFRKTSLITLINCCVSFVLAFGFAKLMHFGLSDSVIIGIALMFSSTILAVKLLPTTKLHQGKMGAVCISILIAEDIIAVFALAFLKTMDAPGAMGINFLILIFKLVVLVGILFLIERFVIQRILLSVDRWQEAIFILGLAWCFGIASISHKMGLYFETGAFFAGVVLARHPISRFISEELKPIRDFFLVLFFFVLGVEADFFVMRGIFLPGMLLAILFIVAKPWLFQKLLVWNGETTAFGREAGIRLGQLSEFSLLIGLLAYELGHITPRAFQFIELVTIITFVVSSYVVIYKYPTPIGTTDKFIKD